MHRDDALGYSRIYQQRSGADCERGPSFCFNAFFSIGWLGVAWLYPAEISGLGTRAPTNAPSTASNWTFNFVVVMVIGLAFNNISWGTIHRIHGHERSYHSNRIFVFPETGGRSLEDVVFASAYNAGQDPVKVSLRKDVPLAGSLEADEILGVSPGVQCHSPRTPSSFSAGVETPA
ncbi:hypothetical protein AZE42_01495 [Rhizopogon vesiculosus]|uniref:Uncharacterized protein n=1 Tax=Rhizopogon vesiculosus TaxID=180088 RepID=A0A1J8QIJ0_9AGAM|nr:hypothetical protein AZE42_01495 [Rhizopogon vesiculosus]